ncbi:MAG TPA: iron export ABC transporter permease subunit FetB [Rhodoblastus sp.]|nr:iron export ABC transporter permease subunit FetB [Rhodoblastus sp.]
MNYVHLSNVTLAAAAALILINAALSVLLELGLARRLLVAALRMTVQLALIGLVLTSLFSHVSPLWTSLVALAMILFAGYEISSRLDRPFSGRWSFGLGASCMATSALVFVLFSLAATLHPDRWYDPRNAIPLLGMVLGNAMTGIALGLNTLTQTVVGQRAAVEGRLALGEDRRSALLGPVRQAARSAMLPTVNSMAATGLVFLPGMMTGQILAGAEPSDAVRYQLLVMFLISGCTGVGAIAAIVLGAARLTDSRHRLRLDRLAGEKMD